MREQGGVCVNGAKPGASACSSGVLIGPISQSIGRWAIGGGKWRAGARVIDLNRNREIIFSHRGEEVTSHEGGGA